MKTVVLFVFIILTIGISSFADDTTIEISYSHRQVSGTRLQDPDIIEGSVIAYFVANNPISLLVPDPEVEQISDTEFRYLFLWDDTEPKSITFVDDYGVEIETTSFPEPVIPFDPANHSIPIAHITTDPANLWDPDIGIHVWGNNENCWQHGSEWEREAFLEFYDSDNNLVISRDIGIRIHGAHSRYYHQKTLRVYFDGYGGTSSTEYDFFGSEPASFQRILLRNGVYTKTVINSAVIDNLFIELGYLASRYNYSIVYLNGEYRGITTTRERIDDSFFEHTHGFDSSDYTYIKDNVLEHGDQDTWADFRDTVNSYPDHTSHEFFQFVDSNLDLQSYIDWISVVIYSASADNGGDRNVVIYKHDDSKWTYLPWDEDSFFSNYNVAADFFNFLSSTSESEFDYYSPPLYHQNYNEQLQSYFSLFNSLMENAEFRVLFSERFDNLMENQLLPENFAGRVNEFVATLVPENDLHEDFLGSWFEIDSTANIINNFITTRYPLLVTQKADFLASYREEVELTAFTAEPAGSQVNLNWRTETETDNAGFVLYRSIGTTDNMIEIASFLTNPELIGQGDSLSPTEYSFTDPTPALGQVNYYQLEHVNSLSETTLHNWVESAWAVSWNGLVINELMADNESTISDEYDEEDDWFEIYNGSSQLINLNGWYLTDNLDDLTKHQITADIEIAPGQYFLFWADNEEDFQGNNHLSFKLSADGEELGIVGPDGITVIDSLSFEEQLQDISFARAPNATGPFHYNSAPTPNGINTTNTNEMMLIINEVMTNNESVIADEQSEYEPWIELFNPLPVEISLNGLELLHNSDSWTFPDYSIAANEYLIIWADGEPTDGILHTDFSLEQSGFLIIPSCNQIAFPVLDIDTSYARIPDGGDYTEQTSSPTPGESNPTGLSVPLLVINEFMAKNNHTIQDEMGSWEDWVEIYNNGPYSVNMEGMYLTDDLSSPTKWEFPDVTIESGGFLLVWCDDDENDGPLHTSFKLSAGGEDVGLYDTDENLNQPIDAFSFGSQSADISYGRTTDAGDTWAFFSDPTPEATNFDATDVPNQISSLILLPNHPNPFNPQTTIKFWLPVAGETQLRVFDSAGRIVKTIIRSELQPGWHSRSWNGKNNLGQHVASGIYYYQLKTSSDTQTRKMLLIK